MKRNVNGIMMWFLCIVINLSVPSDVRSEMTEIPFKLINGLIILEAELDGQRGDFILDTGASDVLINENTDEHDVTIQTIKESGGGKTTTLKSLIVGDIVHNEMSAILVDLSNVEQYINRSLLGILGSDVFSPKSVHLDYQSKTVRFYTKRYKKSAYAEYQQIDYKMVNDVPLVSVEIENQSYTFLLDTGASSHFIDYNTVFGLNAKWTGEEQNLLTSYSANNIAYVVKVPSLTFGDSTYTNVKCLAAKLTNLKSVFDEDIAGIISVGKLSNEVIFDLKKSKFYYR